MTFIKGQSGNPAGRPPKQRALTAILERTGAKSIKVNGQNVSGRQYLARLVWQAALEGRVVFADNPEMPGTAPTLTLDGKQWVDIAQWIYSHIDGPPKQQVQLTGRDDGPIEIRPVDYRIAVAPLAPGSVEDSESSGED